MEIKVKGGKRFIFCCGLKMRRKPFKQPPSYYCNSCGLNIIVNGKEIIEGKYKNFVRFNQ